MSGISTRSCLFGFSKYFVIGDVSELKFDTSDNFSFSMWVSRGTVNQYIFSKYNGTQGYRLFFNNFNTRLIWALSDGSGNNTSIMTVLPYLNNNSSFVFYEIFYHIVVTHSNSGTGLDANNLQIFINGNKVDTLTLAENLTGSIDNSTNFQISGFNGNNNVLIGCADEFAVYNKVLTPEEVLELYNDHQTVDHLTTGPTANLIGYWKMGEGATFPTIPDETIAGNDGTMSGSAVSTDIVEKYPVGPLNLFDIFSLESSGGSESIIKNYLMRGIDSGGPYPSYHYWKVTGMPDLNGSSAGVLPFGGPLVNIVIVREY